MSREPAFIFASDWHLAESAWKDQQLRGDSYVALGQVIEKAQELRVSVVAPGDLFDVSRPDSLSLHCAFDAVAGLQQVGQRLYYTQGQHDRADLPYLSLVSGTVHLHRSLQCIGGLNVYGLDHCTPDALQAELARLPKQAQVLACHQLWKEWAGRLGDASLLDVPGGPRLILSGDYHVHLAKEIAPNPRQWGLSCGSLCMQNIREEAQKHFWVVYTDYSFESVPLRGRRVHRLLLPDAAAVQHLLDEIERYLEPPPDVPSDLQRNLLHIRTAVPGLLNLDQLRERVAGRAVLFTPPAGTETIEVTAPASIPAGQLLAQTIQDWPALTPEVRHDALRLVRAVEPRTLVTDILARFQFSIGDADVAADHSSQHLSASTPGG